FEHILARIKTGDEQALTSIFPHFLELVKKHCKNGVREKSVLFSSIVLAKQSIIAEKKNANIFETSALLENFLQFQNDKQIEEYALESFLECASLVTSSKKSSLPPSIEKSLKYIEEHLHENITLESVASFLNVHPVYLSKLFSSNLSENFKDYVSSKRIEKAKTLLQNTSMPIKEITYTVGYNDQNYFSRLFKSNTGYTPSEYRQLRIEN
ncbi:MAG: helix-turn-helix domain-containing protein, partial [Treponema sp.]|nr:helix-turn-helix domain-containing protein [Treponema sp.]